MNGRHRSAALSLAVGAVIVGGCAGDDAQGDAPGVSQSHNGEVFNPVIEDARCDPASDAIGDPAYHLIRVDMQDDEVTLCTFSLASPLPPDKPVRRALEVSTAGVVTEEGSPVTVP